MSISWANVEKARRHLAREHGTVIKDWGGKLAVALVYPNSYYVGMSNLGVHVLYRLLNGYPDVVCERVFWEKDSASKKTLLLSVESQRPLSDFAVLAFSISYELDYFYVVQVLKASGIPLYASQRDERHPLVIAGGPCVMANPMPLTPFFDCLCNGEAEAIIPALLPLLSEGIGGEREILLKNLAALPGIYVPRNPPPSPVVRQFVRNLDDFPVHTTVLTPDTELGDLYLMEVERGCAWHCRFCLACSIFFPMRVRSMNSLIVQAGEGLKYRKRLGLVGADVADYPHIEELAQKLHEMGALVSVSSLRVKPLSTAVLREMAHGTDTIALAPEAGSQRLRDIIRKGVTEDDILTAMEKVAAERIKQLKLYFMVGLPSETDEDVADIVTLALKCKDVLDKQKAKCRIALNVSSFVPKAGTPFQWLPMESVPTLNHRLTMLKSGLVPRGIQVKGESPVWSEVQAVLAAGDARLAEVLVDMKTFSLAEWRRVLEQHNLDIDTYAHQPRPTDKPLPWAVIDPGTKLERLREEMERALVNSNEVSN
ncbi:MAG: radical SAM protein [Chloroflexi bacterium]|nr:radical SAM protein [Chloroflexota bacterium]